MNEADRRQRLLVLDDDPLIGQTIRTIAEFSGMDVESTTEPSEFFGKLNTWQPDVIALDLIMPVMDGVQVLAHLGQRRCTAGIILTSGVGSRVLDAARRAAEQHGLLIMGVLEKPFSPAELRSLLLQSVAVAKPGNTLVQAGTLPGPDRAELREAIKSGSLCLAYQPKINCQTGTLTGFEALVRWQHPRLGWVSPDRFIPMAESEGLIDDMTEQIIAKALNWFASFRARHLPGSSSSSEGNIPEHLHLALNISALTLPNFQLFERVYQLCTTLEVSPEWITFELTESSAMNDPVVSLETLTRLRVRGFKLSIDDFGTGYSSMIQLVRLPFTEIKIDRTFVFSCGLSPESRKVVRSIVELGKSLGLITVAEGVESREALAYLQELGCDLAQGYYFAKPMMPEELARWLLEYSRDEELRRQSSLESLRILDTPREDRFDRITRLAQRLFTVPSALVTLIDRDRQWFKSAVGIEAQQTLRSESFCTFAIQDSNIMLVEDATRDDRVKNLSAVTGEGHLRFYAGYPLRAPDGSRVGTLCILDTEPRTLEQFELDTLSELGRMVEMELGVTSDKTHDPLTGVLNRWAFEQRASGFLRVASLLNLGATLVLFELTGLARLNAEGGHQSGNEALAGFVRHLQQTCRESDLVGRYGGDELAVLMLDANVDDVSGLLQRVDGGVGPGVFDRSDPLRVGYRVAHASLQPGEVGDIQSLMANADHRLRVSSREC
jgi:diguanylate cyclase (GGDEF)-like protein